MNALRWILRNGWVVTAITFIASFILLAANYTRDAGTVERVTRIEKRAEVCRKHPRGEKCQSMLEQAIRALDREGRCLLARRVGLPHPEPCEDKARPNKRGPNDDPSRSRSRGRSNPAPPDGGGSPGSPGSGGDSGGDPSSPGGVAPTPQPPSPPGSPNPPSPTPSPPPPAPVPPAPSGGQVRGIIDHAQGTVDDTVGGVRDTLCPRVPAPVVC